MAQSASQLLLALLDAEKVLGSFIHGASSDSFFQHAANAGQTVDKTNHARDLIQQLDCCDFPCPFIQLGCCLLL